MRFYLACLFIFLLTLPLMCIAQESGGDVEQERNLKYLTPNQTDNWKLVAKAGEILTIHVATPAFDPVLKVVDPDGKILVEVDDPGSESRIMLKLVQDGNYEIQIMAFKGQGGGRYELEIVQFMPTTLTINAEPMVGQCKENNKSHHDFIAKQGQILIPKITCSERQRWEIKNPKGELCTNFWHNALTIDQDGLYCLIVYGRADSKYQIEMKEAQVEDLVLNKTTQLCLESDNMKVYNIYNTDCQVIEVELEKQGRLDMRLIFAPVEPETGKKSKQEKNITPVEFFPVSSKGQYLRLAGQLNCVGRYRLQILAISPVSANMLAKNPVVSIREKSKEGVLEPSEKTLISNIAVGKCWFINIFAMPGELFKIRATSSEFDPIMRLYYPNGTLWLENDDSNDLSSEMLVMFQQQGNYLLQVGSLGNGGGGNIEVSIQLQKLPHLAINSKQIGHLNEKAWDYWSLPAQSGKYLIVSVRSSTINPRIEIHSPSGVKVAQDDDSGIGNNCLLSFLTSESGRYTFSIYAISGEGDYQVCIWEAD